MDGDAYLIQKTYTSNNGIKAVTELQVQIFVHVESVSRAEYFSAGQNGLASNYVLKTNSVNYNGENEVIYEGKRYSIYRTYRDPESDQIELYLELIQASYECVIKTMTSNSMDDRGFRTYNYNSYNAYCNIKSATDSQNYEASASGTRIDIVATVRISDYLSSIVVIEGRKVKPSLVVIDSVEYEIYKTIINDTTVELLLTETING